MRHWHYIRLKPVVSHEEPAGAPLLDRVEPIAGRGLRAEVQGRFGIAQYDAANSFTFRERLLAQRGIHAQCRTRNLHDKTLGRNLGPEKS